MTHAERRLLLITARSLFMLLRRVPDRWAGLLVESLTVALAPFDHEAFEDHPEYQDEAR